jgi:hypothetical protein
MMMKTTTIKARFASRCGCCGRGIAVGELIRWRKGAHATHEECPSASASIPVVVTAADRRIAAESAAARRRNAERDEDMGSYGGSQLAEDMGDFSGNE